MNVTIGNRRISGTVSVPAYEPVLHKYLICQALTEGCEPLQKYGASASVSATIECLDTLVFGKNTEQFNCSDSEMSYRYILPVAAAMGKNSQFFISEEAMAQPIADFLKTLKVHGIRHEYMDRNTMRIWGQLTAGTYILPAYINSQFISGLLFALPLLQENSILMIDGIIEDTLEITQTIDILSESGIVIDAQFNTENPETIKGKSFIGATFKIAGNQHYKLEGLPDIDSDWTIAAYMLTAGAICGGPVTVAGLYPDSAQESKKILRILETAGVKIEYGAASSETGKKSIFESLKSRMNGGIIYGASEDIASHVKATGPWSDNSDIGQFFQREHLKAINVDATGIQKLVPAIALVASAASGTSCIMNVQDGSEETENRLQAVIEVLEQFGIMIWESDGNLYIEGYAESRPLSGGCVNSYGDPYIAMMEGIASSISSSSVIIENADAVESIYPAFYGDLIKLRSR